MTGVWIAGVLGGLALMVWDQARFRRFHRHAVTVGPEHARLLGRHRFRESASAALAVGVLALATHRALSGPDASTLPAFVALVCASVGMWVAVSWALTRRSVPESRRRSPHERRA